MSARWSYRLCGEGGHQILYQWPRSGASLFQSATARSVSVQGACGERDSAEVAQLDGVPCMFASKVENPACCFCATRSQANVANNYLVELQDRFGENGIGNSGDFPDVLPVAAMRRRPRYRSGQQRRYVPS